MRHLGGIAALIAVTVGAYWGIHRFDFVAFDDDVYLLTNPAVADGLNRESVGWAFRTGYHSNWHPLTWLSYLVEIEIFGLNPGVMHATNLALHLLVCVLLYALLWRCTGVYWPSLFVALLFAVHPLHVEAVAWISERKELLGTAFALAALHGYASYARSGAHVWYGLALLAFAASLMAKPMWVTFPVLLVLFDLWPLDRRVSIRRHVMEKTPLVLLALGCGVVTLVVQSGGESVQSLETIPAGQRFGNAILAYGIYLYRTFWPSGLAIFYPHPRGDISWALVVAVAVLLAAISVTAYRLRERLPPVAMAWGWFIVALAPVIGILQVGGHAYADRYTYAPHVGLFAGLVFAFHGLRFSSDATTRARGEIPAFAGMTRWGGLFLVCCIGACTVATFAQTRHWRDTETLFTRAVNVTDGNVLAHAILARYYMDHGEYPRAEYHARATVSINEHYAAGWRELGIALHQQGRFRAATSAFDRFLAQAPESATGWYYLARALDHGGESGAAAAAFERALSIAPGNAVIRNAYGNALARAAAEHGGNFAEAEAQFRLALRADPEYGLAHLNLGRTLSLCGKTEEAQIHLDLAEKLMHRAPEGAKVPSQGH